MAVREEETKPQLDMLNRKLRELTGIYHQAAASSGMSDSEFWVWYTLLVMEEEFSQQDICAMWSLPKQTVNSVVKNMVKKGFMTLETVPGTRNRKLLRLTDSGRAYGETVIRPVFEAECRTFERLSVEERRMCIVLLDRYIHSLREELCNPDSRQESRR